MSEIVKPQFYTLEGDVANVDESVVDSALASGQITVKKGSYVPVINPDGQPTLLPDDLVHDAIKNGGYTYDTPTAQQARVEKREYETGIDKPIKAIAAGIARGVTVGASDFAAAQAGEEYAGELEKLQKYYPRLSAASELAGAVAPALMSGGTSLAARAAAKLPSALVSSVAKRAADKMVARAAVEGGLLAKGLEYGGKLAAAPIIEGSVFGAGGALSEASLGHPNEVGEQFLANVGPSVLTGASFGLGIGALAGGVGKVAGKASELADHLKIKSTAQAVEDIDVLAAKRPPVSPTKEALDLQSKYGGPASYAEPIELTLNRIGASDDVINRAKEAADHLKPNAKQIEEAALRGGYPVAAEQLSSSEFMQSLGSWVTKLDGTPAGMARQQMYADGYSTAAKNVKSAFGDISLTSAAELGNKLKTSISAKVEEANKPIAKMFDAVRTVSQNLKPDKKLVSAAIKELESMPGYGKAAAGDKNRIINMAIRDLKTAQTLDDINQIRIDIRQGLPGLPSAAQRHTAGIVSDALDDLFENSVLSKAKDSMETNSFHQFLGLHKAAKAKYKTFKEDITYIAEKLGRKNIDGPRTFIDFLEESQPEKVARRLFSTNDSEFIEFMKKGLPEEFAAMKSHYFGELVEKNTVDGVLNVNKVIKEVNGLSKEMKNALFSKDDLIKINDAKTWIESIPKNINPSGTARALILNEMISSPGGAFSIASKSIAGAMASKALNAAVKPEAANQFRALSSIKNAGVSVVNKIADVAEFLLKGAEKVGKQATPASVIIYDNAYKDHKKDRKKYGMDKINRVLDVASNNDLLIDAVSKRTAVLSPYAPNIAKELGNTAIRGVGFLSERAPKNPLAKYGYTKAAWEPSDAEVNKWLRYHSAVEKPLSVLDDIKNGVVSAEGMEALKVVYPSIYNSLLSKVIEKIAESKEPLPFKKRKQIATIFGVPTDFSFEPSSINLMQNSFNQAQQPVENSKFSANVKLASNSMSDTERTLTRG